MRPFRIATLAIGALLVAGCAGPQAPAPSCSRTYMVGFVTDTGTLADHTVNAGSWQGVQDAVADRALCVQARVLESKQPQDYAKNIQQLVDQKYDMVVTVGLPLGYETRQAAEKNPQVKFVIADFSYDKPLPNLMGLVFKEDQAGFLVGALVGLMTRTNVVAGVYGLELPGSVRYRRGFENGARSTNSQVKALGVYEPPGGPRTFNNPDWGKAQAETFFRQNADIVFAAGGNTGNGALLAATQQNKTCVGADVDQFNAYPDARKCLMTSAVKRFAPAVKTAIEAMVRNQWPGSGVLTFDSRNNGIGIAPYRDFDSKIPADVKTRIDEIKKKLADGSLSTGV